VAKVDIKAEIERGAGAEGARAADHLEGRCRWQIVRIGNKARSRATKRTKDRGRSGSSRDRSGR